MPSAADTLRDILPELRNLCNTLLQCIELQPHGLLLADDRIGDLDAFESCLMDGVVMFRYSTAWSLDELHIRLSAELAKANVSPGSLRLCGWMFHGNSETFTLAADAPMDLSDRRNVAQWQPVIDLIQTLEPLLHSNHRRIDLLGCSLNRNPDFETLIGLLRTVNGLMVCTSDDMTGNTPGADWELEDGKIELLGTYLRPDTDNLLADKVFELNTPAEGATCGFAFRLNRQIVNSNLINKDNMDDKNNLVRYFRAIAVSLRALNLENIKCGTLEEKAFVQNTINYCENINTAQVGAIINKNKGLTPYPTYIPSGTSTFLATTVKTQNGVRPYKSAFFNALNTCFATRPNPSSLINDRTGGKPYIEALYAQTFA